MNYSFQHIWRWLEPTLLRECWPLPFFCRQCLETTVCNYPFSFHTLSAHSPVLMLLRSIHIWVTSYSVQICLWPVIWCTSPLTLLKATKKYGRIEFIFPSITTFSPIFSTSIRVTFEYSLTLFPYLFCRAHGEASGLFPSWIHPFSFCALCCSGAGFHRFCLSFDVII